MIVQQLLHRITSYNVCYTKLLRVSQYVQQNNGVTLKVYPANASRANFNNGFPYLLKLGERDQSSESRLSNKNFKIYRYADLLLMLAEISNELQNGEQLGYVSEVLNRVGMIV